MHGAACSAKAVWSTDLCGLVLVEKVHLCLLEQGVAQMHHRVDFTMMDRLADCNHLATQKVPVEQATKHLVTV